MKKIQFKDAPIGQIFTVYSSDIQSLDSFYDYGIICIMKKIGEHTAQELPNGCNFTFDKNDGIEIEDDGQFSIELEYLDIGDIFIYNGLTDIKREKFENNLYGFEFVIIDEKTFNKAIQKRK